MSLWVWLILALVLVLVVGFLYFKIRNRRFFKSRTPEEKARRTVGELLSKTQQQVQEEIQNMTPDERMKRWKDLYGD